MKKTLKSIDLSLISGLVLSIIVLLMGVIVMVFKSFGLIEIVLYISILFYIYALFSTIAYFVRRKEGDYEILLLSLINIITATFMFIFKIDNPPMILGAGMTIYTILVVINRGLKILQLKKIDSFMWIIKFIITFLIAFLGILTIYNLFNEVTVQTMMFGFYFMSLGFMLTLESIIEIFITDATFRKLLSKVIEEEQIKDLEEIKETKEVVKKETPKQVEKIKIANKVEIGTSVATRKTTKKEVSKKSPSTKVTKEEKTKPTAKAQKTEIKTETPKKAGRPKKETKETTKTTKTDIKKEEKRIEAKPVVKKSVGRPKKTETKSSK